LRTRLRFRRPKIASWFADFPYCGRALYCTLCVSGNALNEVMTPRETMAVTHTFPRFRIAIFHLVSHALPLAHRSVNCDVLSPTSSSPLYRFFLVSKKFLCPFAIYRTSVVFPVRKVPSGKSAPFTGSTCVFMRFLKNVTRSFSF